MNPKRIFISYSHEDSIPAADIRKLVTGYGFDVLWDGGLRIGDKFSEQLQAYIAHSHVFLPLITPDSESRAWVNQEIGFAKAHNIGIFPVSIGPLPQGFIAGIECAMIKPDLSDVTDKVTREQLSTLASTTSETNSPLYECAATKQERAQLIASYCSSILRMKRSGTVRHRSGGLSSFAIPNLPLDDNRWISRYPKQHPDANYRKLLREERRILEQHARECGCKLIIRTGLEYAGGPISKISRTQTLVDFLENNPHPETYVAIDNSSQDKVSADSFPSFLSVGNWLLASSHTPNFKEGYKQTIITRHARTVEEQIVEFDHKFATCLKSTKTTLKTCLGSAIIALRNVIQAEEAKI